MSSSPKPSSSGTLGAPGSEAYEPTRRMSKALRLGMLESTKQWLESALADHPAATAADLLERVTDETIAAELDLDRYDELNPERHSLPSRNAR